MKGQIKNQHLTQANELLFFETTDGTLINSLVNFSFPKALSEVTHTSGHILSMISSSLPPKQLQFVPLNHFLTLSSSVLELFQYTRVVL